MHATTLTQRGLSFWRPWPRLRIAAMLAILTSGVCAAACPSTEPVQIGELQPGILRGYLAPSELFDSAALLVPPASGSVWEQADRADAAAQREAAGEDRLAQAVADADLATARVLATFATPLGVAPDPATTPHLVTLLRRVMADAGMATVAAKRAHGRQRPFVVLGGASCTPEDDAELARSGAFPSAHAAMGWAIALVLVEMAPARAGALLARGLDFGDSRVVCGAHWRSDVEAGRVIAAGVVAQLHANPDFRHQSVLAAAEIAHRLHGDGASAPMPAEVRCDGRVP